MGIFVINRRDVSKEFYKGNNVYIYIGRPSILGNPFKIGPDGTRLDVVEKYKDWLLTHIKMRDRIYNKLKEISEMTKAGKHVYLGCWCAPLPCHGDVIKEIIEQWINS